MTMEFLSRLQFAFSVIFHIIFPAFSIGLATFLAIFEGLWLKTKNSNYLNIVKFWTKIFALTFGMGVVSGIVIEFQFGTNWSGFAREVGPALGALFTYEVLTAFFIEAGALGIMLFGWGRVHRYVHYAATLVIWFGVMLSAFWILAANSWMQTPAGVTYQDHHFIIHSWSALIFNPSVMVRYEHMVLAALLSTLMMIIGVAAYYAYHHRHIAFAKTTLKFGLVSILILSFGQVFIGDEVGLEVHENQPIKTAAIEGVWHTQKGAPLVLFAWPDEQSESNLFAITIPHGAALINTHQWDGKLQGLSSVPKADQPFVPIVFFSFRIMVAIGLLMVLIGLIGTYWMVRGKLFKRRWFLKLLTYTAPLGFIAIITGWVTAEVGRQPWVVYNYLRTADAVSPLAWWQVALSFSLIILVYGVVFGFFYIRYLLRIIQAGPDIPGDERMPYGYFQSTENPNLNKENHPWNG